MLKKLYPALKGKVCRSLYHATSINSAHTTTDTAVVLLLLIVMLPIGVLAGIKNWLLPLASETD